ncbi:general stress response protein CsbD [Streptococcus sanguinis SK1056]|uniref:General stress response protein CsbD n=1 Tax=Streptococcus sanguinis SK1056 TaxID=888820 RepID=F3U8Y0_STRSA|nr:general stress response protein CsbD [Streptococcus sanguinis SK1056]
MSLENKFDEAKGAVKEGVGKVTGDNKTEAEGFVEKQLPKPKKLLKMLKKL